MRLLIIFTLLCAPLWARDPALPASLSNPLTETPTKTPQIKKCLTTEKPSKNIVGENEQKKLPSLLLPKDRDQAVRLQVFLDQKHFGPGFIDGKPGKFTKLAVKNYNISLGREKNDPRVVQEALMEVTQAYATAIVPIFVKDFIDHTLPQERSLQAGRKSMPYRSVAEFMAERYHTSEDLLIAINSAKTLRSATAHSAIKVPNIRPFLIEKLKHGRTYKREERLSAQRIVVDTQIKQIYVYTLILPTVQENANGTTKISKAKPQLVASFPITPGKPRFIPVGIWNLKNSVELPIWRYDKQLLETGVRGELSLTIPAGPNNPVGVIWNGLSKSGIGIHGTNNPRTIGRAQSAGCIRLSNWDAVRFPNFARPGAIVEIR
jgi:lipoprotein-anchoring transpeptidase ErfK/SrfK